MKEIKCKSFIILFFNGSMFGLDGVIVKGFCLRSYLVQKRNEKEEWGNKVRFAWGWGVAAFNP